MRMIRHILVVCVGNICRSPMAEAVLRNALRGQEEITVESAGLGALVDWPASGHAEALMRERGIDISAHRARQLTPELIHGADLILVMETGHKKAIEAEDATARGKVFRLGEWRDTEIEDPYQQSKAVFAKALASIDGCIDDWVERLST
jgi:protein-tyrosine phosphatase